MQLTLDWQEPLELGTSGTLRENIKNFDFQEIPQTAGIYLFYRETRSEDSPQEVLYIGQTVNIRASMEEHFNSLSLIEALENTPQGKKCLTFAKVTEQPTTDLEKALNLTEKGLIQYFLDNNHPLLNKTLNPTHFDEIVSKGDTLEVLDEYIYVYSPALSKNQLS